MAAPRLPEDEKVLFTTHPGSWGILGYYFWTLGLYAFWRRNKYFVVTDHRVIVSKGIIGKTQRNVPLEMIQDASFGTIMGIGSVVLSSADGLLSVQKMGPMKTQTAHEMIDMIMNERKQVQGRLLGGDASSSNASSDAMAYLQQLRELRRLRRSLR